MELEALFKNLGLNKTEAKVYLASLELGQSLPKHLAQKAAINRTSLYQILPNLLQKGLISETVRGKRRYLVAEDPQKYIDQKESEIEQIKKAVPQLHALLATATVKPAIVFYEGIENLKKLYMDNLKTKAEILEFVSIEKIHPEIEFHSTNYYIPERIKRKIPIKIIVSGSVKGKRINLKTATHHLREVKNINEKLYPIPLDLYIYDDNISFSVYRTDSEPIGVIIRSREIAQTMRSLHKFIWNKAGQ